jgi:hypothetical protein
VGVVSATAVVVWYTGSHGFARPALLDQDGGVSLAGYLYARTKRIAPGGTLASFPVAFLAE